MATTELPTRSKAVITNISTVWSVAIDRHEKATSVKLDSLAKVNNVDELLAELHLKERQVKDHRHNGSKLDNFRMLLKKSLKPVEQLCDVAASVASITANSISADLDKIAGFFEDLNSYLKQLKILEGHLALSPDLEAAIAEVLTSFLVLCGICAKYVKKKRIVKALQNLVFGEDDELSAAYADFQKAVVNERGAVLNTTFAVVGQLEKRSAGIQSDVGKTLLIAERTDQSTKALITSTEQLNKSFSNQMTALERDDVLANLSLLDFHEKQKDVFANHHRGTGQWLLNTYNFQKWFTDKETSVLWCPGIPGAGKTVITSLAVNHIHEATRPTGAAIAYIYFDYKNPGKGSELQLLGCIARQLTEQMASVPAAVKEFCDRKAGMRRNPTSDELISLIESICLLFPATYVFVDALDECPEDNRDGFLSSVEQLVAFAKFFITSRPGLDLQARFTNIARVDICAETSDIQAYLEYKINRNTKLCFFTRQDVNLKRDIVQYVSDRSSGMFLLAHLQLDHLCRQQSLKDVRRAMSALPRKISEYYDEAVKRIDCEYDGDRHLAWKALSYVFCAKRPLNVLELRHALAVEDGDTSLDEEALPILEILLNVTIGLLRVDESQIIGLVHHTLQEYLEKHSESLVAHADLEIAKISLTYLSFDVFKQGPCKSGDELRQRLKRHCFLDYAAHHWGHHLVKNQHHPSVVNLLSTFLEEKEKLASFVQILYLRPRWKPGWYDCYPRNFDTLHVMAYWGLDELLTLIFREEMGVNNRDSYGATALQQGAEHGHKSVVQFLLSMGAEVNTSNERGETPLYWAARNGHKTIVELLISCRATALTKDIEGWTALDWAAAGGNSDLLKTLLKYGADVVEDDGKVKALLLATGAGHELTVQTLLESGAEINARDSEGSTALDWAVPSGNENMVRLLLCNGANVKSKDEYGNTAMHWATPYMALVRLLLEYGAEVDARNDKRQTALCWAAQDGPVEVAELLLENKANIDAQDVYGFTALHRAALRGRKGMVRLLLEKGADPNIMDKDRWTPLHVAASKRYDDLAGLLRNYVENGEEILHLVRLQQQDSRKQALLEEAAEEKGEASTVLTGLRAAIQERQFGRSQLLLDRGADVDGKEVGGFTALILAASVGDLQAMQLLLENGADIDLGGYDERTPLHWASERGETASVKLLVERGANVDARTFQWTAVLLAARKAHDGIVTFLIQSGADVNVEDYHGRTALHWVVMYGGRATARLLADKGANINATDRWGKTALMWAIEKNRIKTVRVLLDTGTDVEVKARYSVTALHLAAFLGYESIVRCLLERGANVNAVALWRKAEHDADTESDATSTPIEYLNEMLYQWRLEKDDLDQDEVNEETRFGFTAGQLATRCEHFAIQRLLEH